MALRTVHVPPDVEEAFAEAERVVSRYFESLERDPTRGAIEIAGERYVLVRAASLSVEFFELVGELFGAGRTEEADEFARNILFDLAHAIGRSDAQNFHSRMGLSDPVARLSAGPVHFAHAGWAFVDIDPSSRPVPSDDYYLLYDHPYSFEADAWLRAGRVRRTPACIMNAGYSSGWCEASFGLVLAATEVQCRACGDERCRFVMAPPARIEAYLAPHREAARATGLEPRMPIPDFFARKRTEEELRRAHARLEQRVAERTAELEESNRHLRREMAERARVEQQLRQTHKLEALGRLAGGVAHDFNTLLGVILGNAGLLGRRLQASDERGMLETIVAASEQAASLTRQLLAFSRAGPRGEPVEDVSALVAELTRLLGRVIGEDVELEVALDPGARGVELDRVHFEQVVMNLVINARDAMPAGGTLSVSTAAVEADAELAAEIGAAPGAYVRLSVRDTGEGMSEEVSARIFEPYFTTKETAAGTGLGLATVYGIVKGAGGAIAVRSAVGQGTTFDVFLPAASRPAQPASSPGGPEPPRGVETVLVVDDETALRSIIARALREAGYQVLEASTAREALDLAAASARSIALLVTDVVMPGMSGPQLALRLLAERPTLRVLYMSGYAAEGVHPPRSAVEGASVLAKPFGPDELLRRVRAALDEPG